MPDTKQPYLAQIGESLENITPDNPSPAVENNPCSICRANRIPPPCKGHGGQSGGGTGDNSKENADKSVNKMPVNIPGHLVEPMDQMAVNVAKETDIQQSVLTEKLFNPETISDLLAKRILVIQNDQDSGILTIKLQCTPNLLSEEQRNDLKKFVGTILKELAEFKKEKDISANCAMIDRDNEGNFLSLRINLPTPAAYDASIQRLASKNLLPLQNIEQKDKVVYEENMNHFNPSPLSMKPSPNKGVKSTEEEKDKIENKDEATSTLTF